MTTLVIPIHDTDNTVSRLAAKCVIEQLMFSETIVNVDNIIYKPRGGVNRQKQVNADNETLKLEVANRLTIEYRETPTPEYFNMDKYTPEYPVIFKNSKLGVALYPMYSKVDLELTVTYTSKSYNELRNWLNAFERKYLRASPTNYQTITYNYTIPDEILAYLHSVHDLSEQVAGYNVSLKDFILNGFTPSSTAVRHNLNDTVKNLVVNVGVSGCLGTFTTLPNDEIDTSKEPPISTLTFTYMVTYERITALLLEYQLFIHNQLIDVSNLLPYADRRPHFQPQIGDTTFSQSINLAVKNLHGVKPLPNNLINEGDGFMYPNTLNKMIVKATTNIVLNLLDLRDILDLNDLPAIGLPDWLVPMLQKVTDNVPVKSLDDSNSSAIVVKGKLNSKGLCTPYGWAVFFEVFEVNETIGKVSIEVDNNFHLVSTYDLNPRNRYYLRVSVTHSLLHCDFSMLKPSEILQLLRYIYPKADFEIYGIDVAYNMYSLKQLLYAMDNTETPMLVSGILMTSNINTRRR